MSIAIASGNAPVQMWWVGHEMEVLKAELKTTGTSLLLAGIA